MEDTMKDAELMGTLRRKKNDHGVFEDPWKTKVIAWISKGYLHMKPATAGTVDKKVMTGQESFDMAQWKIEKGDKGAKVLLVPQSGDPVRLRADTQEEADMWHEKLNTARLTALKRVKEADFQKSLKIAEAMVGGDAKPAKAKRDDDDDEDIRAPRQSTTTQASPETNRALAQREEQRFMRQKQDEEEEKQRQLQQKQAAQLIAAQHKQQQQCEQDEEERRRLIEEEARRPPPPQQQPKPQQQEGPPQKRTGVTGESGTEQMGPMVPLGGGSLVDAHDELAKREEAEVVQQEQEHQQAAAGGLQADDKRPVLDASQADAYRHVSTDTQAASTTRVQDVPQGQGQGQEGAGGSSPVDAVYDTDTQHLVGQFRGGIDSEATAGSEAAIHRDAGDPQAGFYKQAMRRVETEKAKEGEAVVVSREFASHAFCQPFVGRLGKLVRKGSDGGGGWHVAFEGIARTQFFSTGGYGGLYHLEYAPASGLASGGPPAAAPQSQETAGALTPVAPPSAAPVADADSGVALEAASKQDAAGAGGSLLQGSGALQQQEQAELYMLVADLVERRLLTGREERDVYQAIARREPHLTYAFRQFKRHGSHERFASQATGPRDLRLQKLESDLDGLNQHMDRQTLRLEQTIRASHHEMDQAAAAAAAAQRVPDPQLPAHLVSSSPETAQAKPPLLQPADARAPDAQVVDVTLKLGLDFSAVGQEHSPQRKAFEHNLASDLASASGASPSCFRVKWLSAGSVVAGLEVQADKASGQDAISVARHLQAQAADPSSPLRNGSITAFVLALEISPRQAPAGAGGVATDPLAAEARGSASAAGARPSQGDGIGWPKSEAADVPSRWVVGSLEGLPSFVERGDKSGHRAVAADGALLSELLLDDQAFERFLVEAVLIPFSKAMDILARMPRTAQGLIDCVAFLDWWGAVGRVVWGHDSRASAVEPPGLQPHSSQLLAPPPPPPPPLHEPAASAGAAASPRDQAGAGGGVRQELGRQLNVETRMALESRLAPSARPPWQASGPQALVAPVSGNLQQQEQVPVHVPGGALRDGRNHPQSLASQARGVLSAPPADAPAQGLPAVRLSQQNGLQIIEYGGEMVARRSEGPLVQAGLAAAPGHLVPGQAEASRPHVAAWLDVQQEQTDRGRSEAELQALKAELQARLEAAKLSELAGPGGLEASRALQRDLDAQIAQVHRQLAVLQASGPAHQPWRQGPEASLPSPAASADKAAALRSTADFGAPAAYLAPPTLAYHGSSASARAVQHEPSIGLVTGASPSPSASAGPASWGGQQTTITHTVPRLDKQQPMSTGSLSPSKPRSPKSPPAGGGPWSSSVEGRINNVLAWLDDTQQAESAELQQVKRQLEHPGPSSDASEPLNYGIDRDDTLAAVKGDQDTDGDTLTDAPSSHGVPSPTVTRVEKGRKKSDRTPLRGAATKPKGTPGKISKCGLGLTLRNPDDKAGISIKRVKDGGPAALCGKIKPGDRLISVDQVELSSSLSGQDMAKLIVGRKGSVATLRIQDQTSGKIITVVLQRFESNEERAGEGKDDTSKDDTSASMPNKDKPTNASKSEMAIDQTSNGNGSNRVAVPSSSIASSRQNAERMANGHGPGGLFDSSVMSQGSWMSDVTAAGGKQVKDNSKLLDKPPVHQSSWSSDITAAAGMPSLAKSPPPHEEGPPSTSLQDILAGYSALEATSSTNLAPFDPHQSDGSPSTAPLPADVAAALSRGSVLGASQINAAPLTGSARRRPGAGAPIPSKVPPEPSFEGAPQDPSEEDLGGGGHDYAKRGLQTPSKGGPAKLYGLGVTFKKSDGLGGMVVKRVKSDGAAASTGALFAGDRVLRINGTALDDVTDALHLSKLTHGEALTVAVLQVVRLDGREEEVVIVRGNEES